MNLPKYNVTPIYMYIEVTIDFSIFFFDTGSRKYNWKER